MSRSISDRNTKLLAKALHAVITDAVETANKNLATKDDTKRPAAKDDIKKIIKDGFKNVATKDDIKKILNKLAEFRDETAGTKRVINSRFDRLDARLGRLDTRLGKLDKNMQGQFKKINRRLDRLIEKKLNQSSS